MELAADPPGAVEEENPKDRLPGELFYHAVFDPKTSEKVEKIVKMFLKHGLNIGGRTISNNKDDEIRSIWELVFIKGKTT